MKEHPYYDSKSKKDSFAIAVFCMMIVIAIIGILGLGQLFL
jgi:diacylglycerol kinase